MEALRALILNHSGHQEPATSVSGCPLSSGASVGVASGLEQREQAKMN